MSLAQALTDPVFKTFEFEGRRYEVMYETSGRWKGFVHIFDPSRPKAQNRDVVVSGAKWDGAYIVASIDDIFDDALGPKLIAPASVALRAAFYN